MTAPAAPVAIVPVPATPAASWWTAPLAWIGRLVDRLSSDVPAAQDDRDPTTWMADQIAEVEAPARFEPGALQKHYRAFSLLQPRIVAEAGMGATHRAIASFRERAKAIRDVSTQEVNDAACAVLDTFVELVEAFVPLWTAAGEAEDLRVGEIGAGARAGLRDQMLATIAKLEAELVEVLSQETVCRDRFDTVQRYVELRYGEEQDYGLSIR